MMPKRIKKSRAPDEVQVFELTMDNDEDQDKLNRQLQKPGERSASRFTDSDRIAKKHTERGSE
jgi:hypothetical protein